MSAARGQASGVQSVSWAGRTDVGRFRSNNEDAFLAFRFDGREVRLLGKSGSEALDAGDYVFAVSDGLGGARSGEFASRYAADRIARFFPRVFRLSGAGFSGGINEALHQLFTDIHGDMLQLGRSYAECAGMGTTLSLCWLRPGWMYFAHVGDSRIYHIPAAGGMTQVTHDHTHVGYLRRKGELNERQARMHPRRNVLHQALGAGQQIIEPQIGALPCTPGDRFLVCSDGLVDGLWDRRIEEMVRAGPPEGGEATVARLVAEAVESSGRDNVTVILVGLPPPADSAPGPAR